jgi:hypothetical protein
VAHDPKLLEPLRKDYKNLVTELAPSGLRFERAALIVLAAHGLRFLEILSLSPFKGRQRERVIKEMLGLAAGESMMRESEHPGRNRRSVGGGSRSIRKVPLPSLRSVAASSNRR